MCRLCVKPTRREFCAGAMMAPLALGTPRGGLVEPSLRLEPSSISPGRIAVTLDACPGHFDPRVATALVTLGIPATIFITALWMEWNPGGLAYFMSHPEIFHLENHGALHLPPVLGNQRVYGLKVAGSLPVIRAEVLDGAAAVRAATGKQPSWYRGAAGLYSPETIPFIEALGFKIAGYSLNSDEGASLPAAITAKRLAAARDGEVTEGHINQPLRASGAGIAEGLAKLKAEGMQFTTL